MLDYSLIRTIHISAVVLSITLFALRGSMQLAHIDWRRWRLLRILPHITDTVLLTAAVALTLISHQYPGQQPWLTAKVVALFAYIFFGALALRKSAGGASQKVFFVLALLTVAYIVKVAITRSPTLGLM